MPTPLDVATAGKPCHRPAKRRNKTSKVKPCTRPGCPRSTDYRRSKYCSGICRFMDRDIDSAQRHARSGGNTDVFLAAVAASDAWSEFLTLAIAAGLR